MRLVKVDQLTGSEILARSITTSDYKEILAEGTLLKLAYIPRLEEIGIKEVFVKDNELDAQTRLILKEEINKKCKDKVKEIISKHMYNKSQDMTEIAEAADRIITNVISDDNVTQQIYDIKERSADIYEHSINLCTLAALTALKLDIPKDKVHDIAVGCLLHDLGLRYLTIPYQDQDIETLNKVELTLAAGKYIIGKDIPAGNYTITCTGTEGESLSGVYNSLGSAVDSASGGESNAWGSLFGALGGLMEEVAEMRIDILGDYGDVLKEITLKKNSSADITLQEGTALQISDGSAKLISK